MRRAKERRARTVTRQAGARIGGLGAPRRPRLGHLGLSGKGVYNSSLLAFNNCFHSEGSNQGRGLDTTLFLGNSGNLSMKFCNIAIFSRIMSLIVFGEHFSASIPVRRNMLAENCSPKVISI